MDPQIYKKTHTRIRELNGLPDSEIDPLVTSVSPEITGPWYFVADSTEGDTAGIEASRVLILGPQRRVPAENMLSAISYLPPDGTAVVAVDTMAQLPAVGSIDKIYRIDHEPGCSVFYVRWVDRDLEDPPYNPRYAWVATNVPLEKGDGTVISDVVVRAGLPYATRAVDINIGAPEARVNDILRISESTTKRLVHSKSGVGDSGASAPGAQTIATFGDAIKVPEYEVDSTGHVKNLTYSEVTMPDTPASTANAGLVMVGQTSDIKQIGSSASIGTANTDGYMLMAPANHVHTASNLVFTNIPVSGSLEYQMSGDKTLDMLDLHIYPATNNLNAIDANMMLTKVSANTSLWQPDRTAIATNSYSGGTGTYEIPADGTSVVMSHISNIAEPGIYLATAELGVFIGMAPVSGTPVNVPFEYACELNMTGDPITRKFNFSGTHGIPTVVSGEYYDTQRVTVSALLDLTSANAVDLTAKIQIYGTGDGRIFKGNCTSFKIVRLK